MSDSHQASDPVGALLPNLLQATCHRATKTSKSPIRPKNALHFAVPAPKLFRHRNTSAPPPHQSCERRVIPGRGILLGSETTNGSGGSFRGVAYRWDPRPQGERRVIMRTFAKCAILRSASNHPPRTRKDSANPPISSKPFQSDCNCAIVIP